jgi:uncharacterized membrane protein YeaQ/YmgE (transglycosylase-associated protein family)
VIEITYIAGSIKKGFPMGIIWTIIIGAVIGAVAKFIMPGDNEPKGFVMTTILGIAGALLASFVGFGSTGLWGFVTSVIGAVVLLVVYGIVTKNKA